MRTKVITKVSLIVGYAIFAAFSAYFTATSLSLNLMQGTNFWIVYIMVFIIAILAGYCLTEFIRQIQRPTSKSKFLLTLLGFLLFWGVSFTTNVHYFFVDKHGYGVLNKELASCKDYLTTITTDANRKIEEERDKAKTIQIAQAKNSTDAFVRELNNTMANHLGFGDACINILNAIESSFMQDTGLYHDGMNDYTIFDDMRDIGDRGITSRARFPQLQAKYDGRIQTALTKKLAAIDRYYSKRIVDNEQWNDLIDTINYLEHEHLPRVQKDNSVDAYYKYYMVQQASVVQKMPDGYLPTRIATKAIENIEGDTIYKMMKFNVYPSERMFETLTTWSDILHGYLPSYMKILQWLLIALIIDIVSFLLFYLARK